MKKQMMVVAVVGMMLSLSASGKEFLDGKNWYNKVTSNGTVKVSDRDVQQVGSRAALDLCLSKDWDASEIAAGLPSVQFSFWLATSVSFYCEPQAQVSVVAAVMQKLTQYDALYLAATLPRNARPSASELAGVLAPLAKPDASRARALSLQAASHTQDVILKSFDSGRMVYYEDLTISELVQWLLLCDIRKNAGSVASVKERIKVLATPLAKRALRSQGKTFVSSTVTNADGTVTTVNPIELAMKPVVDALNAPKIAGLEAALRGIGVDIADIPRVAADWDKIAAEKDAIFYGEKPAHPGTDGSIILLLGPTAYNAWVAEYNNGTAK